MPKQKTTRKFGLVEKEILYSESWSKLTHCARVIYLHLKGEFDGTNGDHLKLPFSKMRGIVSNASFWRGIKTLEEIGFIDVVFRGGRPVKKGLDGRPKSELNIYKISGRWRIHEKSIEDYKKENTDRLKRRLHREYCERLEEKT